MRTLSLLIAVSITAACTDRQPQRADSASVATLQEPAGTSDSAATKSEELELGTEQFPMSKLLGSLAAGAPPATLKVANTSCIPGKCRCSGTFAAPWQLESAGVTDNEIAACTVADFDGDGDWDASLPGGEGKSVMVFMQDTRPHSVWYLDGGAAAELYAPRAKRGPNGEPTARLYALRDGNALYEWRDSLFVLRRIPAR